MMRWLVGCCLTFGLSAGLAPGLASAAAVAPGNYAGELLQEITRANPDLRGAAISAAAPKTDTPVVVASTQTAASGTPADPADRAVMTNGVTSAAIDQKAAHFVVRLPLHDVSGDTVGALTLKYAFLPGMDVNALKQAATKIRDGLQRRVSHAGNLFDAFPYEPDAPPINIEAQRLVNEFMGEYPRIEILAIHTTPPDSDYNIIAGSNIGRIGKKADNDDMRCVFTGKPNLEINSTGKRFESEMQLHDRTGKVIGALGVVFPYKSGADKQALHTEAEKIRAEMEKRIPDAASLFRPAS